MVCCVVVCAKVDEEGSGERVMLASMKTQMLPGGFGHRVLQDTEMNSGTHFDQEAWSHRVALGSINREHNQEASSHRVLKNMQQQYQPPSRPAGLKSAGHRASAIVKMRKRSQEVSSTGQTRDVMSRRLFVTRTAIDVKTCEGNLK